MSGVESRLARQISFLLELDKLKLVLRRSHLIGQDRRENSAEHSWHVTMVALLLAEYAAEPVDVGHVLKLMLVHDIVEIDAGDVVIYDTDARRSQAAREALAADRLFGLLPTDQAEECRRWWEEFEAQSTPESRFAKAADRLIPVLQNFHNQGRGWREMNVSAEQIVSVNQSMAAGAPEIWSYVEGVIRDAVSKGFLPAVREKQD
jgi:putative hydrolase of HD superfamily